MDSTTLASPGLEPGTVGVLLTTHDRVEDARVSMEIIRGAWEGRHDLSGLVVVHAYNGNPDCWPGPYLEDELIWVENERTHFRGHAALLDAGMDAFAQRFPRVRYVVAMAADVWAYRPDWIARLLLELDEGRQRLAASRWGIAADAHGLVRSRGDDLLPIDGLSTDFFVIDREWATTHGAFPLKYGAFLAEYRDLLNYFQEMPFLERHFAGRYLGAVRADMEAAGAGKDPWGSTGPRRARALLRLLHERPIDPSGRSAPPHKGHWPEIGLCTTEDHLVKRAILLDHPELIGPTINRMKRSSPAAPRRPLA